MSKHPIQRTTAIVYPESDGKRMAENTLQFQWIVTIKEGLDAMLPTDFVAGDLLWYPVEGDNSKATAPDTMVCLGRPKGHRRSYKQWEEDNVAPQVVFEILSHGNTKKEMAEKLVFYEDYGVMEYYLYDPDKNRLRGWQRGANRLIEIVQMHNWVSPLLGIRFELSSTGLTVYRRDGERFLTYAELEQQVQQAKAAVKQERQQAEQAKVRAEHAEVRAEQAEAELAQERAIAQRLADKLKALGIDPSNL